MSPYIPRGYVTTANAVDHIFRARNPDLATSTSAREAEMRQLYEHYCSEFPGDHPIPARLTDAIRLRDAASKRRAIIMGAVNWRDAAGVLRQAKSQLEEPKQTLGTFGEEDLARLRELDRIGTEQHRLVIDAAMELRSALAEGDLVAVLNYEEMPAVSEFRWRKDDGLTIVSEGRLSHQVEGTHTQFVESMVVMKKEELAGWLDLNLQTGGEVTNRPGGRATEVVAQTLTAEKKMTAWLKQKMLLNPDAAVPKATMRAAAVAGGLQEISDRAFDRAWQDAGKSANAPRWLAKGRRKLEPLITTL
jgi:hypothetical protein